MTECNICFEDYDMYNIYFCSKYHYICRTCYKKNYCLFCTYNTEFNKVVKIKEKCRFFENLTIFFKHLFD